MLTGILGLHSVTGASASNSSSSSTNDQFLSNVKLLLGFGGADGSTTFTDESPAAHGAGTAGGNAQVDTAQKKFGTGSLLLDGTGDSVLFADNADWDFGAGDFTMEAFVRFNVTSGFHTIISKREPANGRAFLWDYDHGATDMRLVLVSDDTETFIVGNWAPSTGTWYHVCAERNGNIIRLYADGVMLVSSVYNSTINDTVTDLIIGTMDGAGGQYFNGWIDEVRITKGVARYASDSGFTPPTAAFPRS